MGDRFTEQQKLDAVVRELKYRSRVYERRVAEGKMTQAKADYEEAVFRAIAEDYREKAEAEKRAGELPL